MRGRWHTMRWLLVLVVVSCVAVPAVGRTWTVEKDGLGDFEVIQNAIDVAASGDTILVRAGRYADVDLAYSWSYDVYACVSVSVDLLTIIGEGESTIIGPEHYTGPDVATYGISCIEPSATLRIRDLKVVNGVHGISFGGAQVDIRDVRVVEGGNGIATFNGATVDVYGSFIGGMLGSAICTYDPGALLHVESVEIRTAECGVGLLYGGECVVSNTRMSDVGTAILSQWGGVLRVDSNDLVATGWGVYIFGGTIAAVTDSRVIGGIGAIYVGNSRFDASGGGSEFVGGERTAIECSNAEEVAVNGCDIRNSEGLLVKARQSRGDLTEPVHLDFSDNYWGLIDGDEIAIQIEDYYDFHPLDHAHFVIVDYEPFRATSTPVQKKSLSGVKALFR